MPLILPQPQACCLSMKLENELTSTPHGICLALSYKGLPNPNPILACLQPPVSKYGNRTGRGVSRTALRASDTPRK